jgi:hypothetical protein
MLMSVEEVMKEHGFKISASCAGQAWYTKFIEYKGRRAYITVMDKNGEGLPQELDEPVRVGIYELRSGEDLEDSRNVSSLNSYLENLE